MAAIVAAYLGNGWTSLYEIWARDPRIGVLPPLDLSDKTSVQIGNVTEQANAELFMNWYEKYYGESCRIRRMSKTYDLNARGIPWATAHIDRLIVGKRAFLECKNVGWRLAHHWDLEVPGYVIGQVHHYLWVLDYEYAFVSAILGGSEHVVYRVERSKAWDEILEMVGNEFWRCIQEQVEPQMDFSHKTTDKMLAELYPGTSGDQIELPARATDIYERIQLISAQVRDMEKEKKELTNEIKAMMGEASIGKMANGMEYTRKEITVKPNAGYSYIKLGSRKTKNGK